MAMRSALRCSVRPQLSASATRVTAVASLAPRVIATPRSYSKRATLVARPSLIASRGPLASSSVSSLVAASWAHVIPARTPVRFMSSYPPYIKLGMPALSPTMERGTVGAWKVKPGDQVKVGQLIADINTDKATVGFDSTEEGYFVKALLEEGVECPVGQLIAIMTDNKDDVAKFADFTGPAAKAAPAAAAPTPAPTPAPVAAPTPVAAAPTPAPTPAPVAAGARPAASPAARRLAGERGVPLTAVAGTGPDRRIVAADILEYKAPAVSASVAPVAASASGEFVDLPNSAVRKVIAQRLTQSKQTIPHYYLTVKLRMDKVIALRAQFNAKFEKAAPKGDKTKAAKLSVNDFVIKAAALALRQVPAANSSWQDSFIRQYNYVDISVAVSTDGGLITPIVKDADIKGLSAISGDVRELAGRARLGKLQPSEYQGGTFTISNLGMYGVQSFTAIINPPQSCILAVGATEEQVIVNDAAKPGDSKYTTGQFMNVTLSCDHRVVDGAVGAQWLAAFRGYIEDPQSMLL